MSKEQQKPPPQPPKPIVVPPNSPITRESGKNNDPLPPYKHPIPIKQK